MDDQPRPPRSAIVKLAITIAGGVVVLAGVVMLVTPGPGLVTIAAGLAILATEYAWAKHLLRRVRVKIDAAVQKAKERRRR